MIYGGLSSPMNGHASIYVFCCNSSSAYKMMKAMSTREILLCVSRSLLISKGMENAEAQ